MIRWLLKTLTWLPHYRFRKALVDPRIQEKVLNKIIKEIPKIQHYKNLTVSKDNFDRVVPIVEYDDIRASVELSLRGIKNAILYGTIKMYEKTSGTTTASKHIPYTTKTMYDFFTMLMIWCHDLVSNVNDLSTCGTFFSISPTKNENEVKNVGMNSDDEYFPWLVRKLFSKQLLIPRNIKSIKNQEDYDKKLLEFLSNQKSLEIISIWNPTYLLVYLDKFPKDTDFKLIWPNLKIISVWGDATAEQGYNILKNIFPHVYIQKKGLLSTEFPISIPLAKRANGHYPLIHLIYFEFKNSEKLLKLHEVKIGETYTLVLSKPGGFIRYNTHDQVEIIDIEKGVPIFKFIGRDNITSDLVGEKLTEVFVRNSLKKFTSKNAFLRACYKHQKFFYELVTEENINIIDFETELRMNIHYDYARKIGQLGPLRINQVDNPEEEFLKFKLQMNLKRGDVKFSHLLCLKQ